jgi:hypothetical protein
VRTESLPFDFHRNVVSKSQIFFRPVRVALIAKQSPHGRRTRSRFFPRKHLTRPTGRCLGKKSPTLCSCKFGLPTWIDFTTLCSPTRMPPLDLSLITPSTKEISFGLLSFNPLPQFVWGRTLCITSQSPPPTTHTPTTHLFNPIQNGKNRFLGCFASFSSLHSVHYPYSFVLILRSSFCFILKRTLITPAPLFLSPPMSVCGLRLIVAWRGGLVGLDGRFGLVWFGFRQSG